MPAKKRRQTLAPGIEKQVGALTKASFTRVVNHDLLKMKSDAKLKRYFASYKKTTAAAAARNSVVPKIEGGRKRKSTTPQTSVPASKAPKYNTLESAAGKAMYDPPLNYWIDVAAVKLNIADRLSKMLMQDPYNIVPAQTDVSSNMLYAKCHKAAVKLGLFGSIPEVFIIGSDKGEKTRDKALLERSFATWNPPFMTTGIVQSLANLEDQIGSHKSFDMMREPVACSMHAREHPSWATEEEKDMVVSLVEAMSGEIEPLTHG